MRTLHEFLRRNTNKEGLIRLHFKAEFERASVDLKVIVDDEHGLCGEVVKEGERESIYIPWSSVASLSKGPKVES